MFELEEKYERIREELFKLTDQPVLLSASEERRRDELESEMWELERQLLISAN